MFFEFRAKIPFKIVYQNFHLWIMGAVHLLAGLLGSETQ